MKTQFMLKPLAFALAAVLSAGAYATGPANGGNASIDDSQHNHDNQVRNESTNNNASVSGSLGSASGNVGVNVAAGDNNQQANAGAIAVADAYSVFGASASANIDVDQRAHDNNLDNFSVPNNASLTGSANGASGNVGINIAAGNYNQQKNDMAIGVSEKAYSASAGVNVSQVSKDNTTRNIGQIDTTYAPVNLTLSNNRTTYKGTADQVGDLYPDMWSGVAPHDPGKVHPGGQPTGHFDLDSQAQGAQPGPDGKGALLFNEAGTIDLSGSITGQIPIAVGYTAPVVNNASVSGSLNNVSGNVGVNVAAGGGNQQSNSLAVAVGCTACASGGE